MKWLSIALAFAGASALACPADDVKDAQAMPDKPAVEAKAPAATAPAKTVAVKKVQPTKVVEKSATALPAKSSL